MTTSVPVRPSREVEVAKYTIVHGASPHPEPSLLTYLDKMWESVGPLIIQGSAVFKSPGDTSKRVIIIISSLGE